MERKLRKSKDKTFSFFIFRLRVEEEGESGRQSLFQTAAGRRTRFFHPATGSAPDSTTRRET